jgi:hypothetical protein
MVAEGNWSFRPLYDVPVAVDDRCMKNLTAHHVKVEHKSHRFNETGGFFAHPTGMNEHTRSRRLHGPHAVHTQRAARASVMDLRKQLPQPTRGLLISLGWLRLFQRIVTPQYAAAGRRGSRYER